MQSAAPGWYYSYTMAIITKHYNGTTSTKHAGRVLSVRRFESRRNMSDTLDYSDWRTVDCVSAYVYLGRTREDGSERPVRERFATIDCSNHFAWRGADHLTPGVDGHPITRECHEDMIELDRVQAEAMERELREEQRRKEQRIAEMRRKQARQQDRLDRAAREQRLSAGISRGTAMRVVKGKNAGREGVVAFISNRDGSVLLKDAAAWQDRNADGVWVKPSFLEVTQ